jgi:excisionase family DNA binding protein
MAEGVRLMLTVQDLAKRLGVPERTIRRWIDLHGDFLGAKKEGRRLLVPEDAFKVADTIKELYEGGATASQVGDALRGANVPQVIDVAPVTPMQAESVLRLVSGQTREVRQAVEDLRDKQDADMKELLEQLRQAEEDRAQMRQELREIREFLLAQSATPAMAVTTDLDSPTEEAEKEKKPGILVRAWRAFWSD